ncbi:MAG: hypothetical protein ACLSHL_09575 [Alistipes communis]
MTEKNLVKAEDGSLWIHTERQKTGTPECVRLMEIPLAILEKYKGMDADGKLLPMLTKESMNRHLKKMSVMCGINRPISSPLCTSYIRQHNSVYHKEYPSKRVSKNHGAQTYQDHTAVCESHAGQD